MKVRPDGLVCTVTEIEIGLKLAVSAMGPFIATVAGLLVPLYDPAPVPLQAAKPCPAFAEAEMLTLCPLLKYPLGGLTVPPVPALMVKRYCGVKLAV